MNKQVVTIFNLTLIGTPKKNIIDRQ